MGQGQQPNHIGKSKKEKKREESKDDTFGIFLSLGLKLTLTWNFFYFIFLAIYFMEIKDPFLIFLFFFWRGRELTAEKPRANKEKKRKVFITARTINELKKIQIDGAHSKSTVEFLILLKQKKTEKKKTSKVLCLVLCLKVETVWIFW